MEYEKSDEVSCIEGIYIYIYTYIIYTPFLKTYQGDCICKDDYICKVKRNVITLWSEHNNRKRDSEPGL